MLLDCINPVVVVLGGPWHGRPPSCLCSPLPFLISAAGAASSSLLGVSFTTPRSSSWVPSGDSVSSSTTVLMSIDRPIAGHSILLPPVRGARPSSIDFNLILACLHMISILLRVIVKKFFHQKMSD